MMKEKVQIGTSLRVQRSNLTHRGRLLHFVRNDILIFIFSLLVASCQQKIDLKIPDYQQSLVVEGKIETDTFPQVYLTYTTPYFGNHPTNLTDLAVKGAFVT